MPPLTWKNYHVGNIDGSEQIRTQFNLVYRVHTISWTFVNSNIYAVQQDTQSVSMNEFYSALMLARHVSDLTRPSSGALFTSCIRRLWYVVIRVLLDTSNRNTAEGRTAGRVE